MVAANGNTFGVITIAVNKYQGKDNPEKTSFFRVTVGSKTVEGIGQYLTKGRQVAIDSVPVMNSWTDVSGNKRSIIEFIAMEIQLLSAPKGAGEYEQVAQGQETHAHEAHMRGSQIREATGRNENRSASKHKEEQDVHSTPDEDDDSYYGELPF
jgi:single stranded DNA-binding protein